MKKKVFTNYFSNIVISSLFIFLLVITYAGGTLKVFSSTSQAPYYHGNLNNNNVSLMINVYWGTEYIDGILSVLKANEVKTTFFVGGIWVSSNNDFLLKIYNDGHEIANHGYFHKDHKQISFEKNQEEIFMTHKIVKENIDYDMTLFAPPSGSFNNDTLEIANNLGYKTIMWTKDTIDWRDKNTSIIYNRAIANPRGGDLILMHPTKHTLDALQSIIDFYKKNGFQLTTVSKNID